MKRFNNVKMTIFDSTNAAFRLAVEVQLTRKGPDGNYRDLVYTTDSGNCILNPNVYLTMAYRDENSTAVYMSYPQLFAIRKAFGQVKDYIESGDAFITDPNDNSLSVKQTYAEPVIVNNIGKNNNWIQLKLEVIKTGENGVYSYTPGVGIQLSTSTPSTSLLSADEFLTVYTIITDLNLMSFQASVSLAFLNCDSMRGSMPSQPIIYSPYGDTQAAYAGDYMSPRFPQPQTRGYQPYNGTRTAQPYRNNQQNRPMPSQAVQPRQASQAPNQPSQEDATPMRPQNLSPRNQGPIMNMKAVEETPISNYDIDDSAAVNDIFGNS